jgi:hypothetical protein
MEQSKPYHLDYISQILGVLKCIKCNSHENIVPYPIKKLSSFIIAGQSKPQIKKKISHSLFVPICLRCTIEFDRWKRISNNNIRKKYLNLIYILIFSIICYLLVDNLFILIASIIIFSIWLLMNLIHETGNLKKMEFNPRKYMMFEDFDKLYIKSEKSPCWVEFIEWIKDVLYERIYLMECSDIKFISSNKDEFIKCVHCGAKVKKSDIKCLKCNNYLPLM